MLELRGARLRFLNPYSDKATDNERSLVFILEAAGRKALFTGDTPIDSEDRRPGEPIDVLRVGHHGSASSTGEAFRPKLALIGVGSNTYGHPTAQALGRLDTHSVKVRRTDLEGAIRVVLW